MVRIRHHHTFHHEINFSGDQSYIHSATTRLETNGKSLCSEYDGKITIITIMAEEIKTITTTETKNNKHKMAIDNSRLKLQQCVF